MGYAKNNQTVQTIYRYGWMAWVWRALAMVGLTSSAFLVFLGTRLGDWTFVAMALPLGLPSILLPWVLAVRIDRAANEEIIVTNLFFVRRRIRRESLGRPRVRRTAQAEMGIVQAPRAWIPVRHGWPIYIDLYADVPDPAAFRSFFGLPYTPKS